jgi:hypothetical protein
MNRSYSKIRHIQESNLKLEKRLLKEDKSGGRTFRNSEMEALKERKFQILEKGTVAMLESPAPSQTIIVKPSKKHLGKYGGYEVTKGGKLVFDEPHDDCDVMLDKLIGYDSLGGGYNKKQNKVDQRPHDKMVIDCLIKDGFKKSNTGGKYEVYLIKQVDGKTLIVSSQGNPTKFVMNLMKDGRSLGSGEIEIGVATNCDGIVKFANNPTRWFGSR